MNVTDTFDVNTVRRDFPVLNQKINGHPLVYLDNAATTQKPNAVIDALTHFYQNQNANVHRAIHHLGEQATLAYEDARTKVQHFIHAKNREEIIFVRGSTEAINLVASSFVTPRIKPGEMILISEMEHHANIVPWQIVSKNTGANVRVIPFHDNGELDQRAFEKLLTPDTKFLALGHISNALGTIHPIKEMIKKAHDNGTLVLIDGAQGAPHAPIDVQALDCDFYTLSSHKMYGPQGIGALYGKADLLESMRPYQSGGEMITRVTFDATEYADPPYKFEAGTPNVGGAIALGVAIDYLQTVGLSKLHHHETQLLNYAEQALETIEGLKIYGRAKNKASLISFTLPNVHAHDIGTVLNSVGVAIRSGHHCAMPVMDHYQVPAMARASMAFYNTKEDIDQLVMALHKVKKVFGK